MLKCERDSGPPTVRFSSDGKTAAIIYFSTPGTMVQRVLDIATGTLTPQELLTAAPRMIIGNWVYLNHEDGRCEVSVGQSEGQVLIPLATLKERQGYLDVPRVAANGRSVSSDGSELLTTFSDGSAGLWDVGPHMFIPGLIARPPGTSQIQGELARDGRRLLTLDSGGTAGIWDAQSCRPLFSPLGEPGAGLAGVCQSRWRVRSPCPDKRLDAPVEHGGR